MSKWEYWSVGVMRNSELEAAIIHSRFSSDPPIHYCNTPSLQSYPLLHLHVPAKNALARQRPVVDILGHAEEQLVAPEEMRRRFFGDQTHRLGEGFLALGRVEGLPFPFEQFVDLGIRVADARRAAGLEILRQRSARVDDAASTHVVKRDLAGLDIGP